MKLELITLTGTKLDQEVYEVLLPTLDGEIAVLPGHERLVTLAVPGVIQVRRKKGDFDDQMDVFATNGGVVEISPTRIRVLVDEADSAAEIHEAEAKAALERAEAMRASAKTQIDINEAQALVNRHEARLKVASLHRRHHRS
jgi:F-type H+-transporting ATPase subunit epsilon